GSSLGTAAYSPALMTMGLGSNQNTTNYTGATGTGYSGQITKSFSPALTGAVSVQTRSTPSPSQPTVRFRSTPDIVPTSTTLAKNDSQIVTCSKTNEPMSDDSDDEDTTKKEEETNWTIVESKSITAASKSSSIVSIKQIFDLQNYDGSIKCDEIVKLLNINVSELRQKEMERKDKPFDYLFDKANVFIAVYVIVYLKKKYYKEIQEEYELVYENLCTWIANKCTKNLVFLGKLFNEIID